MSARSCGAALGVAMTIMFGTIAGASAAEAVFFDGASNANSQTDPYFHPTVDPMTGETGARYFMMSFWYNSDGQINAGYVSPWEVMFPGNQYQASIQLNFDDATTDPWGDVDDAAVGIDCPEWYWKIQNNDPTMDWDGWYGEHCDKRPDPSLYNSGAPMALEITVANEPDEFSGSWVTMRADNVLPQDGKFYNVQVYVSTGTLQYPPWVAYIVTPEGGPSGQLTMFPYVDSSYFYQTIPDGFSIPLGGTAGSGGEQPMFWQNGCQTTDPNWFDTCYTGAWAEHFFFPTNNSNEIIPYGTTIAKFLTGNYTAASLKPDGTGPFNFPPEVYQTGNDTTFLYNAADIASGGPLQTYSSIGWQQHNWNNPNYDFAGHGVQANGTDPF